MSGASVEELQDWAQGNGQPSARQLLALARRLRDPDHPPGADPLPDAPVEEGRFVVAPANGLGIGKCVALEEGTATVEYFDSVARRVTREVDADDLIPVRLAHQTRCYVHDVEADRWRMGRVSRLKDGDRIIELPDQESTDVSQEHLYVRWARPVDDPIETLKVKGQETVFFRNQRGPFVRALLDQRAASRGIEGLLSASIPLVKHQVEAVRRVLEDPVPRYWLADEPRQGPSVAAAAILRQLLLDGDDPTALVLAPADRVEAWTTVLDHAFDIFSIGGTVDVRTLSDDAWAGTTPDVLLVDAAHRAADWTETDTGRFDALRTAAHEAHGLLLLSDAAVDRRPDAVPVLLHLLDPEPHPLDEGEEGATSMAQQIERRTEVGKLVAALDADAAGTESLPEVLSAIAEAAPDDEALQAAVDELRDREADAEDEPVEDSADDTDGSRRETLRASIRRRLRARHRLHPRALRIRQTDAAAALGTMRTPQAGDRLVDYGLDQREAEVHDRLERWRRRAAQAHAQSEEDYQAVFRHLAEAASGDLGLIADLARCRKEESPPDRIASDYTADEQAAIAEPSAFDGEDDVLAAIIEAAEAEVNEFDFDHAEWLEQYVDLSIEPADACVVYVSRPSVARAVRERLARAFGAAAVGANLADDPPDQVDQEVRRFRDDADCRLLVCDRSAETGPALPFATHLVHYDLPWDPVRVERRIRRLDPVGQREKPLQTSVYLGPELGDDGPSLFETWFDVVNDGLGVFETSLAGLDDAARAIGHEATRQIFQHGAGEAAADTARRATSSARDRHAHQHVFEAVDLSSDEATAYVDDLTSLEERSRELYNRMDPWITKALQFHRSKRGYPQGVIKYEPQYDGRTLVPFDVILNRFLPQSEKPTTYHRSCAVRPEGGVSAVTMFRVGHPFLSALADYFSWDDRGRTYALWRESEAWAAAEQDDRLFFRFDFVVEADPEPAREALADTGARPEALQHRLNGYFPPTFETVFVDRDGQPVTQDGLLKLLEAEPRRKQKGGPDRNVKGDRLPILDAFVDPDAWPERCQMARDAAAEALREHADLQSRCDDALQRVQQAADERQERIQARSDISTETEAEHHQRITDALRAGIDRPNVRLDSVGVVILSGRPLPVDEDEE